MSFVPSGFQEEVFFATVRIVSTRSTSPIKSIGTGFLCRVSLGLEDTELILLVSNKHVFFDQQGQVQFACTTNNDKGQPNFGTAHTFSGEVNPANLFGHPDPDVDLACMNVSNMTKNEHSVYFKTIVPSMFADFSEPDLHPGADVWFVGYPDGRFDTVNNLPLLRRGFIASMPKVNFNGKKHVVIDAHVHGGSSGSPVFSLLGGRFKMVGVVTQTMIRHGKLEAVPASNQSMGVQQTLGLGIVIKANVLPELIEHVVRHVRNLVQSQQRVAQ